MANNAYDGKINIWWDQSAAQDFDHYNLYASQTEITDATGMTPAVQLSDQARNTYQITGLENGKTYYFAMTAVDKNGNEALKVASAGATPLAMTPGKKEANLVVDVYQADRAWAGTTLLAENYLGSRPRIIEVNMLGEVIWEYTVPQNGFVEAEPLPNNHILYSVFNSGIYEIDRSGKTVWSYITAKVDHDADRLPDGDTIFVYGMNDQKSDAQVVEVNPKGEIVWEWYARDYFDKPPYDTIYDEGWAHTNAVTRLPNGNTLISPRNFNLLVEVNPKGEVVKTYGEGIVNQQHDPEVLPNGNILMCDHTIPHKVIELDTKTNQIVWHYGVLDRFDWPVRDANRLPNGNTLITGLMEIFEVTPTGEIVWRFKYSDDIIQTAIDYQKSKRLFPGFYKAERITP
jgi:outer membrane protein assembly factor BamB